MACEDLEVPGEVPNLQMEADSGGVHTSQSVPVKYEMLQMLPKGQVSVVVMHSVQS